MHGFSDKNFGLLIAFVMPGFVALHAIAQFNLTVAGWLAAHPAQASFSGYLFTITASLGFGLLVSAVRWLLVDTFFHLTMVKPPSWDFSLLDEKLAAFDALVVSHYRYYQFYANLAVVIPIWLWVFSGPLFNDDLARLLLATILAECLLLTASRDALAKYYRRAEALLDRQDSIILYPN